MNRRRSHRYGLRGGAVSGRPWWYNVTENQTTTATLAHSNTTNWHPQEPPTPFPERSASQPRTTTPTRRRGLVGAEWSEGWA
jgi:hypothetical protein